jgi:integrase
MATKKLTSLSLKKLSAGDWHDALLPGLILRVGSKRQTWTYRFSAGGRKLRLTLGYHPVMGLSEARDACRKASERIDSGAMPVTPAPHPRSPDALSLGSLVDRYEMMRTREGQRIKALPKAMRQLRLHLKPWLGLPAAEFTKADLRTMRDKLIDAGTATAANRTIASLGPVMRWASEEDLIETNIVPAIRRTPETKRERVLTKSEIRAIWRACEKLGPHEVAMNYGRMVRFLLICAQRRDEAASMKFGDVLNATWRQVENKASRPHSIPLPPLAMDLVGQGAAREYVFGGRTGKIGGFSKLKRMLDEASGVTDWRLHDLRRSAATGMQDIGVRGDIVQAVLNHSLQGVAAVYLRSELEKQKRDALATWAVALTKIVRPAALVVS